MQMDENAMNAFRNLQNLQAMMMPHLSSNAGQLTSLPNMNFPNVNSNLQGGAFNNQAAFKKRAPPKKEEEEDDEEGKYLGESSADRLTDSCHQQMRIRKIIERKSQWVM